MIRVKVKATYKHVLCPISIVLDKREYLVIIRDNFVQILVKTYVVTPHLNRLDKTVQMRGHNIWFHSKIRKIIPNYQLIFSLI